MSIKKDDKVVFELGPYDTPRWMPNPDRVDEFMDAGATGKHGTGHVSKVYSHGTKNMMCIIFDEEYQSIKCAGMVIPIKLYDQNQHLPGFYNIQVDNQI